MANYQLNHTGAEIDDAVSKAIEHETSKANIDGAYEGLTAGDAYRAIEAQSIASDRMIEDAEEACPPVHFGAQGDEAEIQSGYSKFTKLLGNSIVESDAIHDSQSTKVTLIGRNQYDGQYENGSINSDGSDGSSNTYHRSKYIRVIGGERYFQLANGTNRRFYWYNKNKTFIDSTTGSGYTSLAPNNAEFLRVYWKKSEVPNPDETVCIYINYDTPNLPYVAYKTQEITLPNIVLRSAGDARDEAYQQGGGLRNIGVVTLAQNYAIGDTITISGIKSNTANVLSKHGALSEWGTISGTTITLTKALSSGDKINYELATPTAITTSENAGWTELVEVDNFGTILFEQGGSDTVIVPQGYFIEYTVNLVEFLDTAYVRCNGNANNIALIPDAPTSDGTYVLKAVVADGETTYSWEVQS